MNQPANVAALRWIGELATVHRVFGGNNRAGTQAMWNECPRCVFVNWGRNDVYPFEWNIVPYPAGQFGHRDVGGHNFYAISAQTKHPDLAYQFIKFSLSQETIRSALAAGAIVTPVRRSTFNDPLFRSRYPGLRLDIFMRAASDYLVPENVKVPGYVEMVSIANREIDALRSGQQGPEQAAERIHQQIMSAVVPKYRK